ncbi:MAG: SpoVR family protein, partial [Proteobacteria bacterium]|nr:SpoVR family protein [Pseudomonadota bacterium]
EQYNLGNREPNIQVWNVDLRGDRSLTLRHQQHQRRPLGESTEEVMKHVARLWGFAVRLETVDEAGEARLIHEARVERPARQAGVELA